MTDNIQPIRAGVTTGDLVKAGMIEVVGECYTDLGTKPVAMLVVMIDERGGGRVQSFVHDDHVNQNALYLARGLQLMQIDLHKRQVCADNHQG